MFTASPLEKGSKEKRLVFLFKPTHFLKFRAFITTQLGAQRYYG